MKLSSHRLRRLYDSRWESLLLSLESSLQSRLEFISLDIAQDSQRQKALVLKLAKGLRKRVIRFCLRLQLLQAQALPEEPLGIGLQKFNNLPIQQLLEGQLRSFHLLDRLQQAIQERWG
jgi:hypothetical protein